MLNDEISTREKTIVNLFCEILNRNQMSKFDEVLFYESEFKRLDKTLLKLNQYKYKYSKFKRQKKTPSLELLTILQ